MHAVADCLLLLLFAACDVLTCLGNAGGEWLAEWWVGPPGLSHPSFRARTALQMQGRRAQGASD
jgi:hypothetical protein